MVRKHFTFQLWRKNSKWIIKGTELKCSSLEYPILQSVHLIPLLQKKLNCSLFLQFTQVSFRIIKVRKTGTQCITLSQHPKICPKSPLLPQTPAWVCWLNFSCRNLEKCSELSSDLSITDKVGMGIKRVRQSELFDLEISRIRERKILRKKNCVDSFQKAYSF